MHAGTAADGVSNIVKKESHARRYDTETPLAWKQNPAGVIAVARDPFELARIVREFP
jgi:hypothetical protein